MSRESIYSWLSALLIEFLSTNLLFGSCYARPWTGSLLATLLPSALLNSPPKSLSFLKPSSRISGSRAHSIVLKSSSPTTAHCLFTDMHYSDDHGESRAGAPEIYARSVEFVRNASCLGHPSKHILLTPPSFHLFFCFCFCFFNSGLMEQSTSAEDPIQSSCPRMRMKLDTTSSKSRSSRNRAKPFLLKLSVKMQKLSRNKL